MTMHFWTKHSKEEHDPKQPGCMSGLVHAFAHHHWHSNVMKKIRHGKHETQNGVQRDWIPNANLFPADDPCKIEKLLDENETLITTRSHGANKKKSLKSRMRELIAAEMHKEDYSVKHEQGYRLKSKLQRTYSIHHLESIDDSVGKICADWKHSIIFIPSIQEISPESLDTVQIKSVDENEPVCKEPNSNCAEKKESIQEPDLLDILKVDKELLMKNLLYSDEAIIRFSRSALGLNRKGILSRSRSFPVHDLSQRLKVKPIKLSHKQKESWSVPRRDKLQYVHQKPKLVSSDDFGTSSGQLTDDVKYVFLNHYSVIEQDKQQHNEFNMPAGFMADINKDRKGITWQAIGQNANSSFHRRSSSLNESFGKYEQLFQKSYGTDNKLHQSRSLKLTSENGCAPMSISRMHSLSNVDYYISNVNFGVAGEELVGDSLIEDGKSAPGIVDEEEEKEKKIETTVSEREDSPGGVTEILESVVDIHENDDDDNLDLNIIDDNGGKGEYFEEEAEDLNRSNPLCLPEINCLNQCLTVDSISFLQEMLLHTGQLQASEDQFFRSFMCDESHMENNSDLQYMNYILNQSGIAEDALNHSWHSSEQPLNPQLFEEMEACRPHKIDQLTKWPDVCSCWHHQMLFDLLNEVLVNIYESSLPYYPKALSSGCKVRPFPVGSHINVEVVTKASKLLDLKPEGKQSLDCIIVHDFENDYWWMNLQFQSECVALELDDMIFEELIYEVVCL